MVADADFHEPEFLIGDDSIVVVLRGLAKFLLGNYGARNDGRESRALGIASICDLRLMSKAPDRVVASCDLIKILSTLFLHV